MNTKEEVESEHSCRLCPKKSSSHTSSSSSSSEDEIKLSEEDLLVIRLMLGQVMETHFTQVEGESMDMMNELQKHIKMKKMVL